MDAHNLATMANRIAEFFAATPDHGEALQGVATHIAKFWEPRMRRELLQLAGDADGPSLHPLVREVIDAGQVRLPA